MDCFVKATSVASFRAAVGQARPVMPPKAPPFKADGLVQAEAGVSTLRQELYIYTS